MNRAEILADDKRIRGNIFRKTFRECQKDLVMLSFWNLIRASANVHRYNDGFVEWNLVESEVREILESLNLLDDDQ